MKILIKFTILSCIILFVFNCKNTNIGSKKPDKNEVHIYNKIIPKKGTIIIDLEPLKEISSKNLSGQKGISFFHGVKKDENKNLYFMDYTKIKIYKFNSEGKFIKSFLNKGDGPGELTRLYKFVLIDNMVICSNRNKFCCFDLNGNLIREKKLTVQAIELLEHIDEKKYITYNNIYKNNKKIGISCVLKEDNRILKELHKKFSKNIGYSTLYIEGKKFEYLGATSPRFEYKYNPFNKLVYLSYSFEYKIHLISLDGEIKEIIHKDFTPIKITKNELNVIAESYKRMGWPLHYRKSFLKNPPEKFWPVISRIRLLPNGYLGVFRALSGVEDVIDIFNPKGEFIYTIKGDKKIDIYRMNFFKSSIGIIKHEEEKDTFTEYKVKNIPLIYDNN